MTIDDQIKSNQIQDSSSDSVKTGKTDSTIPIIVDSVDSMRNRVVIIDKSS